MAFDGSVQGRWTGRLIDVLGFEGELSLDLTQEKRTSAVTGTFIVELAGQHASVRRRGSVRGGLEKDRLVLTVDVKEEPSAQIELTGDLLRLAEGGVGLCATYSVSARRFASLQGGVACASTGRPLTAVAIEREAVAPRTPAPASGKRSRRRPS
jgi:hypothetical protein